MKLFNILVSGQRLEGRLALFGADVAHRRSDSPIVRGKCMQQAETTCSVESAQVIADRDTGNSKGFGFVEMASDAEAQAAINGLKKRNTTAGHSR